MSVPQKSYDEIVDLFVRISSTEVLAFRPSAESRPRTLPAEAKRERPIWGRRDSGTRAIRRA